MSVVVLVATTMSMYHAMDQQAKVVVLELWVLGWDAWAQHHQRDLACVHALYCCQQP